MFGGAEGEQGQFISNVMKMLTDQQTGGLAGLVKAFEAKGLNDIVSSWIGTGENKAISTDWGWNVSSNLHRAWASPLTT
jgi:uncharacterized protein YidB (DUF937 family)